MRRLTLSLAAIVWLAASTTSAQYDQEPRRFEPPQRAGYLSESADSVPNRRELTPADPPVPSPTMPAQYDAPIDGPRVTAADDRPAAGGERPVAYQRVVEPPTAESSQNESPQGQRPASDRRYANEPALLESPASASSATHARAAEHPRAEVQISLHTAPRVELASASGNAPSEASPSTTAPATLPSDSAPALPLAAPQAPALAMPEQASDTNAPRPNRGVPSIASVIGSLAVVLGLLMLVAWMFKRSMPKAASSLPPGVVEVLGRAALAPRQYVHLVRVGNKLLLVSVTPSGAETLTEITDPLEVDRLAGMCMQSHPNSSSQAFRQVFQQFSTQPTETSFVAARRRDRRPLGGTDA